MSLLLQILLSLSPDVQRVQVSVPAIQELPNRSVRREDTAELNFILCQSSLEYSFH